MIEQDLTSLRSRIKDFTRPSKLYPALTKQSLGVIGLAIGLVAYAGLVGLHWQNGTLRDDTTPYTLGWYTLAFVAYLIALWGVVRRERLSLGLIFSGAIAFRLLLLLTTPTLSDDVYRYMWDGYIANNGVSPYAYPIDSPQLDYLDTPQRALANNRWMASPYLPAAQILFAGLTWLSPTRPGLFQAVMLVIDILNGLLLVGLLRLIHLPTDRVLLYLWNPLIVVESAHGAHVDTWMIFLMLLALWLTFVSEVHFEHPEDPPSPPKGGEKGEIPPSGGLGGPLNGIATESRLKSALRSYGILSLAPILLALATLTKGLPALFLSILFWRWRWGQLALYGLVTIGLLIPAGLAVGWGVSGPLDGTGLFGAIRIYADQWNFNSGLFYWLETTLTAQGVVEANDWAKRLVGVAMLATLLVVWLRARRIQALRPTLRLMAVPFMAYILLTTTVHPWYLMATLAFIPFLAPAPDESPWRWPDIAPWLYLSWALALSYLTYLDPHDFRELTWVRRVEWWGVWGLLTVWLLVVWQRRLHRLP